MVLNPTVRQLPTTSNAIRLDGSYLVVIAETGYGAVMATFAWRNAERTGAQITSMTGVFAHSSELQSGVTPVARMLDFINSLDGNIALKRNHITDAARYAADN